MKWLFCSWKAKIAINGSDSGVKSISEVISAIKQVATTVHNVDYEKGN